MNIGKLGVNVTSCRDCEKFYIGVDIYNTFSWRDSIALSYDKENEEILISEEQLMRIIQMVNPMQPQRKIKVVSQEEIFKYK